MSSPVLTSEELQYAEELRRWRERRGMTKATLADRTAYSPSRISHIEAGRQRPTQEFTHQAERALQTGGVLLDLWRVIARARPGPAGRGTERDLRTIEFVSWLADHSELPFPEIYAAVCAAAGRLEAEAPSARHDRGRRRREVTRRHVADTIRAYYGTDGFVDALVDGDHVALSVHARPCWLQPVELGGDRERFRYRPRVLAAGPRLDDTTARAAIARLAGAEVNDTVMVNNPLYRLLDVDLEAGRLAATVTTVDFAEYVLTTDLLGDELVDSISHGGSPLTLRATLLPDLAAGTAFDRRACVGGLNALVAVARAARPGGQADYVLFTQERSGKVLNLAGALATLPKAFHQPVAEAEGEVALSSTLRRELEEELLGRQDLEQLAPDERVHVDPMHEQLITEPLRWLLDRPGSFRAECVGFGVNMVTGNYDFPCLVVINDQDWWARFGHLIEKNWEASHVHRFSTLDTAGLRALVDDPRWSNEGLFALLLGLRRLDEVGDPTRLAVPSIDLEVR